MLVINVVYRCHRWLELLVASFIWKLLWYLLRKGAFSWPFSSLLTLLPPTAKDYLTKTPMTDILLCLCWVVGQGCLRDSNNIQPIAFAFGYSLRWNVNHFDKIILHFKIRVQRLQKWNWPKSNFWTVEFAYRVWDIFSATFCNQEFFILNSFTGRENNQAS